ncbi:hypothetical protein HDU89_006518 [Geranomyces variabilis]|nr:hypothetical protein HDU89_006518 [Geranomyces variabilis]
MSDQKTPNPQWPQAGGGDAKQQQMYPPAGPNGYPAAPDLAFPISYSTDPAGDAPPPYMTMPRLGSDAFAYSPMQDSKPLPMPGAAGSDMGSGSVYTHEGSYPVLTFPGDQKGSQPHLAQFQQPHLQQPQPGTGAPAAPIPPYFGPYLRYGNVDYNTRVWTGSIMVITLSPQPVRVTLSPTPAVAQPLTFVSAPIDSYQQHTFHRIDLFLHMTEQPVVWRYVLEDLDPGHAFEFNVAAVGDKQWRFAFHSCNGFSSSVKPEEREKLGGVGALWKDVLTQHRVAPFYAMLGGGDQVYGDPVFKAVTGLQEWLAVKGKENRRAYVWTPQLDRDVSDFYFNLYSSHFATPNLREALASIPSIFQIDDHDIMDGWGSYPDYIQLSNVFQNIGRIAFKFYYLFQQQTNLALLQSAHQYERITPDGRTFHFIKLLGPLTAVVGPDTRGERTRSQIMSPASYDLIFNNLARLPPTVKHVIWMLAVPIVYPRLAMPETLLHTIGKTKRSANDAVNGLGKGLGSIAGGTGKLLSKIGVKVNADQWQKSAQGAWDEGMGHVKKGLGKSGLMSGMISAFGEVDLLDDMIDHWTHPAHNEERTYFIMRMQAYANQFRRRTSFISGDVHCCGFGNFYTAGLPHENDPAYMVQVIASAIVNIAPPAAVIKLVHHSAKRIEFTPGVTEEMIETFAKDVDGKALAGKIVLGRRNWGFARVGVVGDDVQFVLRVEGTGPEPGMCVEYPPVVVPALV